MQSVVLQVPQHACQRSTVVLAVAFFSSSFHCSRVAGVLGPFLAIVRMLVGNDFAVLFCHRLCAFDVRLFRPCDVLLDRDPREVALCRIVNSSRAKV